MDLEAIDSIPYRILLSIQMEIDHIRVEQGVVLIQIPVDGDLVAASEYLNFPPLGQNFSKSAKNSLFGQEE